MGDNIASTGTIMGLEDESDRILHEVRYFLELKWNLISLGVLNNEGCNFKSQDDMS